MGDWEGERKAMGLKWEKEKVKKKKAKASKDFLYVNAKQSPGLFFFFSELRLADMLSVPEGQELPLSIFAP